MSSSLSFLAARRVLADAEGFERSAGMLWMRDSKKGGCYRKGEGCHQLILVVRTGYCGARLSECSDHYSCGMGQSTSKGASSNFVHTDPIGLHTPPSLPEPKPPLSLSLSPTVVAAILLEDVPDDDDDVHAPVCPLSRLLETQRTPLFPTTDD